MHHYEKVCCLLDNLLIGARRLLLPVYKMISSPSWKSFLTCLQSHIFSRLEKLSYLSTKSSLLQAGKAPLPQCLLTGQEVLLLNILLAKVNLLQFVEICPVFGAQNWMQ